jgi:hypothetical protein
MAKAPKAATPAAAPARASKRTVSVTYLADKIGDPPFTKWNGILFKANVPVELNPDNEAHYIAQLLPRQIPGQNGETLTKHVEQKMFMGELAKNNPSFEVDGVRARAKKNTRVVPPPGAEWTDAHEGAISYSDEIDESVAA